MDHQTLRNSRDDLNETLKHPLPPPPHIKSSTLNGKSGYDQDFLHQFYYTMPPATGGSVLGGGGGGSSQIGVRLAPLAKFDERDFDLPPPSEAKQKVKLFRALLIFFTTVILLIGLGTAALGVYFILDEERIQMHQIVLVNLKDIKDMAISEAQPMLYFLTLAIVGSGILMTLSSLWNFFASSKENQCLIAMGIFILTLLFAAQLTLGFFGVTFHLRAQEDLRQELVMKLHKNYNEVGGEYFSPALDYIQTKYQCCGIINQKDYDESKWKEQALGGDDLNYPLTCCVLNNPSDPQNYLNPMPKNKENCMNTSHQSKYRLDRYQPGCIQYILDWSMLEFVIIIAISCGSAIIEIMSIVIAIYLIKNLRQRSKDYRS